jgi:hypothetical protein
VVLAFSLLKKKKERKKRKGMQINRIEISLQIKPPIYGQLVFDKDAKIIKWGNNSLLNK